MEQAVLRILRIRLICLGGIKGPLVVEDLDGLVEVETQMDGRTSTQTIETGGTVRTWQVTFNEPLNARNTRPRIHPP